VAEHFLLDILVLLQSFLLQLRAPGARLSDKISAECCCSHMYIPTADFWQKIRSAPDITKQEKNTSWLKLISLLCIRFFLPIQKQVLPFAAEFAMIHEGSWASKLACLMQERG